MTVQLASVSRMVCQVRGVCCCACWGDDCSDIVLGLKIVRREKWVKRIGSATYILC